MLLKKCSIFTPHENFKIWGNNFLNLNLSQRLDFDFFKVFCFIFQKEKKSLYKVLVLTKWSIFTPDEKFEVLKMEQYKIGGGCGVQSKCPGRQMSRSTSGWCSRSYSTGVRPGHQCSTKILIRIVQDKILKMYPRCRWFDFVSNNRLLEETSMTND